MPSAQVIDVERLLEPITEELPQGIDIREDRSPTSAYYTIKDARNAARATERTGMFDEDIRAEALSQWKPVFEKGQEILASTSKDLEVCCWMIEAGTRLHGFPGLRDGLTILHGLVDKFWDGLYPEPDEDGLETKVAPITGLNGDGADGTLLTPIRNCEITGEGNCGPFSFFEYQQIYEASKIADEEKRQARYEHLGHSLEDVTQLINTTGDQFYVDLVDDLDICNFEYKRLNQLLHDHCAHDAPPSSQISSLLDEVLRSVRFLCQDILARAEAARESEQQVEAAAEQADSVDNQTGNPAAIQQGVAGAAVMVATGPITNREQALDQLEQVAEFFRTYEPHTPLADGIDRLVRWGRMTVSELMMELMPEETARGIFSQLTGVAMDGSSTAKYVPPPTAPAAAPAAAEAPEQDGWGETTEEIVDESWGSESSGVSESNDVGW
ncbi:type VI secretion system protein TssA [Sansalvadorimonas sp. 2012CJ34-2]|uniref:Type VI secretion system protein TssA n=1 Tax=Parendozoicomonas callyspongiae TaxID=2942213 RepID=A0ABT0PDA1_9GAMM|nr:type VI secretion system protein TssA [Sansalvadorimonas sp. 2012CJ34-2]MCL6269340.1 type VI secretion system protein TssA [Sansalvadorimonas sp. 2012CJ34-2]